MLRNSTSLKIGKKYEGAISEVFKDSDGYWIYLNERWKNYVKKFN